MLALHPSARLDAGGQMTDAVLADVSRVENVAALDLGGSKALTDEGVRHLARMPALTHLDLSGTATTDRGLQVLRDLPLQTLSLAMTRVTDEGMAHLAHCHALRRVNLSWTRTGDGALSASPLTRVTDSRTPAWRGWLGCQGSGSCGCPVAASQPTSPMHFHRASA
jgi:hypothetical protein